MLNIGVIEVKKLIKIAGLLVVLLVSANASAATYTYIGEMGDINNGVPVPPLGTKITTEILYDIGNNPYANGDANANGSLDTTYHSYSFSASETSILSASYEFGTDLIDTFTISFFVAGESSSFYSKIFDTATSNAAVDLYFATIAAGDYLIKIDFTGNGGDNDSYKVKLYATAVPLPPAALLFISALAGFGVIGRKKASS